MLSATKTTTTKTNKQEGENKARTELVDKIAQGFSNYNETNLATNQNCTNVTALPLPIILEIT